MMGFKPFNGVCRYHPAVHTASKSKFKVFYEFFYICNVFTKKTYLKYILLNIFFIPAFITADCTIFYAMAEMMVQR